jgi:hypothetical protein
VALPDANCLGQNCIERSSAGVATPPRCTKPHPAKSQTATRSSKKCTLDEGPCKADSRRCGAFEELPLCMVTQSPAPPKDGAFFAPGDRLVASVCFAAAKLSLKANSRATAARWRQERPHGSLGLAPPSPSDVERSASQLLTVLNFLFGNEPTNYGELIHDTFEQNYH